jgi:hypothetical protein
MQDHCREVAKAKRRQTPAYDYSFRRYRYDPDRFIPAVRSNPSVSMFILVDDVRNPIVGGADPGLSMMDDHCHV